MQILAEAHLDAGMEFLPASQRRRQDSGGCRGDRRDLELARLEAECRAYGSPGTVCVADCCARLGKEVLSGHRETHSSWQPLQKCPAELRLQHADLLRQRRLGDEQAFRRAGEGALLGDDYEVLELTEIHALSIGIAAICVQRITIDIVYL